MEVEEFLKEAAVMKEIKHPNLVQLLGESPAVGFIGPSSCPSFLFRSGRLFCFVLV
jgi:hypothetical protein